MRFAFDLGKESVRWPLAQGILNWQGRIWQAPAACLAKYLAAVARFFTTRSVSEEIFRTTASLTLRVVKTKGHCQKTWPHTLLRRD